MGIQENDRNVWMGYVLLTCGFRGDQNVMKELTVSTQAEMTVGLTLGHGRDDRTDVGPTFIAD